MSLLIKNKKVIIKYDKEVQNTYHDCLVTLLEKKFPRLDIKNKEVRRLVLDACYDFFFEEFNKILKDETSYKFYQFVILLHQEISEWTRENPYHDLDSSVDIDYIATYRRTLKLILEASVELNLKSDFDYNKKIETEFLPKIEKLLYIGEMIYIISSLISENIFFQNSFYFDFTKNPFIIRENDKLKFINQDFSSQLKLQNFPIDNSGFLDFQTAINNCFGINYDDLCKILIPKTVEKIEQDIPKDLACSWTKIIQELVNIFNVSDENAENFIKGLILSRETKLNIKEVPVRPSNNKRLKYRPILIWNIDGNEYPVITEYNFNHAIEEIVFNKINWGEDKVPEEWLRNQCFKKFVIEKNKAVESILNDDIEKSIKQRNFTYDQDISKLLIENSSINIDIPECGQIDFLLINKKVLYIIECKDLMTRYDIVDCMNDYNKFVKQTKKGFNHRLKLKIDFIKKNLSNVIKHFKIKSNVIIDDISETHGIFVINTPTYYKYESKYKIYTINEFNDFLETL